MARPTAIPAAPFAGCERVLPGYPFADADGRPAPRGIVAAVGGGFVTPTCLMRRHDTRGRAPVAAITPSRRAIAARLPEGVA